MASFNGSAETMDLLKPKILRTLAAAQWTSVLVAPREDEGPPGRYWVTIEYDDRDPKTLAEVFRKEQETP